MSQQQRERRSTVGGRVVRVITRDDDPMVVACSRRDIRAGPFAGRGAAASQSAGGSALRIGMDGSVCIIDEGAEMRLVRRSLAADFALLGVHGDGLLRFPAIDGI